MSHAELTPAPESTPAQAGPAGSPELPPLPSQGPAPLPKQPPVFAKASALKKLGRRFWIGLAAGFVAGILVSLAVSGIGSLVSAATASHVIGDAVKSCSADGKDGIEVGDGGSSITIDTKGKTDTSSGASLEDAACIIKALKTPDSVVSQIDSTTALQGRQTANWENLQASWSYHPDSGLNMIIKVASK